MMFALKINDFLASKKVLIQIPIHSQLEIGLKLKVLLKYDFI